MAVATRYKQSILMKRGQNYFDKTHYRFDLFCLNCLTLFFDPFHNNVIASRGKWFFLSHVSMLCIYCCILPPTFSPSMSACLPLPIHQGLNQTVLKVRFNLISKICTTWMDKSDDYNRSRLQAGFSHN